MFVEFSRKRTQLRHRQHATRVCVIRFTSPLTCSACRCDRQKIGMPQLWPSHCCGFGGSSLPSRRALQAPALSADPCRPLRHTQHLPSMLHCAICWMEHCLTVCKCGCSCAVTSNRKVVQLWGFGPTPSAGPASRLIDGCNLSQIRGTSRE